VARIDAVGWIDSSGNLWLFGGIGTGDYGFLHNDLWEFNPAATTWTLVSGNLTASGTNPVVGTPGTPSATNLPGGRSGAVSWIDASGNFWLFGGNVQSSSGSGQPANDLWEFTQAGKTWTLVSGSTVGNSAGVYGTLGTASASNVPDSRSGAVSWIDSSGNLWLFGGEGYVSPTQDSALNDVWEFSPTAKTWTWVSGSSTGGASGVYGTEGTASSSNVPGARVEAVGWTDGSGTFWLFGGEGYDSTGQYFELNDLWNYQP